MRPAIDARGLCRRFGDVDAVRGVDIAVGRGEIFGLLGPNGAGKTTLVRMLTTLLRPDAGTAAVLGHDVMRDPDAVRRLIGVALQEASLDVRQTGEELLRLHGRLYGLRGATLRRQVDEVVELFDLRHAIRRQILTYSGGMKRRIDVASALLHRPRVLFVDEPTTGLDPTSRAVVWDRVRALRAEYATTVLLTTQYLEEADELADRVGIIVDGRIVQEGAPDELKAEFASDAIQLQVPAHLVDAALAMIDELRASGALPDCQCGAEGQTLTLLLPDGPRHAAAVVAGLQSRSITPEAISVARPTLEDVFRATTERSSDEEATAR